MLSNNPFSILSETISPFAMQSFIVAMVLLLAVGTIIQMIHHKNLTYFFNNAKKAKLSATKELGVGEKVSVIAKTNKSAFMILYQGWASAETSTLNKNQNQYPPKQVNIAPACQIIDQV